MAVKGDTIIEATPWAMKAPRPVLLINPPMSNYAFLRSIGAGRERKPTRTRCR